MRRVLALALFVLMLASLLGGIAKAASVDGGNQSLAQNQTSTETQGPRVRYGDIGLFGLAGLIGLTALLPRKRRTPRS